MENLSMIDNILRMSKPEALASLFHDPTYIRSQFGESVVGDVSDSGLRFLVINRRKMNHSRSHLPAKNLRFPFFAIRIDDGSQELLGQCRNETQAREWIRNPEEFILASIISDSQKWEAVA